MTVAKYKDPVSGQFGLVEGISVSGGGGGGGGISQADADARYLNTDGDTTTGVLTLGANLDVNWFSIQKAWHIQTQGLTPILGNNDDGVSAPAPTQPTHIATKGYVDARTPPVLVLGPAEAVPGGTAAGTVIVRRSA